MALSVALTGTSKYQDGDLELQPDGTWLLILRAHEGKDGIGLESRWNRGLYNCHLRRVPVAVLRRTSGSDVEWLGLALVDHYDAGTRTFLLHGPFDEARSAEEWGTLSPLAEEGAPVPDWFGAESPEDYTTDTRAKRVVVRVVRERQSRFRELLLGAYRDRCAVTGYDLPVALDAAHILPYLGSDSDTARNGLILRADIHRLFDKYLLAVDTEQMQMKVSPRLASTKYSDLDGIELRLPDDERLSPSLRHLDLHRERFLQVR